MTIDPVCPQGNKKEGCRDYTRQEVRFFGGIENTHFGQVCYEADWLMKRIGLALEKLPIEKLKAYYELAQEQHRKAGWGRTTVASQFWFYPIVNRVNVLGDVVLLEKFQMGVFTEVLYAEVDGKPVADVERFEHYPSEGFSRSLTENYDAAAEAQEVLETLRGLTRLAALAKGLTQAEQKPDVDFYLKGYPMEKAETPKEKEVLRVGNKEVGLEISGGVNLMALAMRLKGGDVSALRKLVVETRLSEKALSWGFETEMENGRLKRVDLPSGMTDPSEIAPLAVQAAFLHTKKRYDAAIEAFGKVLQLSPTFAEAYNDRGLAYAEGKQRYELAFADYEKAISLNPNLAPAYINRGLAFYNKREYDRAITDYDKAIAINPNIVEAYINRGAAYSEQG
ncbi:MAG: tetratricopeptide repeat protein, partial [Terriglobia bacterium]